MIFLFVRKITKVVFSSFFVIIFFIFSNEIVFAQNGQAGETASFLKIGVHARPLGFGGAYTSLADDVSSGVWNPSGLTYMQPHELSAMHTELVLNTKLDYVAYGINLKKIGAFSLSWVRLESTGIDKTSALFDSSGNPVLIKIYGKDAQKVVILDQFNLFQNAFYLSYGNHIGDFAFGATIRYLDYRMIESANGLTSDLGIMYKPSWFPFMQLGLMGENVLATPVTWSTGARDYFAPTLKLGLALKLFKDALIIAVQGDELLKANQVPELHAGIEYALVKKYVKLRVGYDRGQFAFGAGLGNEIIIADYAFILNPELENTHRISLSLKLDFSTFTNKNPETKNVEGSKSNVQMPSNPTNKIIE